MSCSEVTCLQSAATHCACVCLRAGSTTISSGTRANTPELKTSASQQIRSGHPTSSSTTGKTSTHMHVSLTLHFSKSCFKFPPFLPMLFLSADDDFDSTFKTNVLVNSSGYAEYLPPGGSITLLHSCFSLPLTPSLTSYHLLILLRCSGSISSCNLCMSPCLFVNPTLIFHCYKSSIPGYSLVTDSYK